MFSWRGYYEGMGTNSNGGISLALSIPKTFSFNDIKGWQGQRIVIDSAVNGYFTVGINGLNATGLKGNGVMYFNTARYDSISPNFSAGAMSGLFEANFGRFSLTKGRFDHSINPEMIQFY